MSNFSAISWRAGADPGFQVRGAHLKKLRWAKGGAKIFWVFRVKNHDFTAKKSYFSNFGGGRAPGAPPPPWIRPWREQIKFQWDGDVHYVRDQHIILGCNLWSYQRSRKYKCYSLYCQDQTEAWTHDLPHFRRSH